MSLPDAKIAEALLQMAEARGDKTFCPSEVARALSAVWRPLMPAIRETAERLVNEKMLSCTQGGRTVSPIEARGPIRLSKLKAL